MKDPFDDRIKALIGAQPTKTASAPSPFKVIDGPDRPRLAVDNTKPSATPESIRIAGMLKELSDKITSGDLPVTGFLLALRLPGDDTTDAYTPFTFDGFSALEVIGTLEMLKDFAKEMV